MKDQRKTKKQLIEELAALRRKLAVLKRTDRGKEPPGEALRQRAKIAEVMGDGLILFAMDGTVMDVNPAYEKITGLKKKSVVGRHGAEVAGKTVIPEERDKIASAFEKALSGKFIQPIETVMVDRKGHQTPVYFTTTFLNDESGRPASILSVIKNIGPLVESEQALRESEGKYRALVDQSPLGILVLETESRKITSANPAALEITGYSAEELARMSPNGWLQLIHQEDRKVIRDRVTRILSEQSITATSEFRIVRKDKTIRWVETSSSPITYRGRAALQLIVADITERKSAEEELQTKEQLFRDVLGAQTELICRFTPDGKLTFVNDAYCRSFGITRKDIIGKKFTPLITKEYRQKVMERITALSRKKPSETHEQKVIGPDGKIRWQQWINMAIFDENGLLVEYQSVGRDITELKQAEEQLRKHKERLEETVAERTAELQKSKEYLDSVIDAFDDPVFVKDEKHRWVLLNDSACRMLGRPREELIGKNDYDILPEDQADEFWRVDDLVFRTGKPNINVEKITWGKEIRTISTKKSLLVDQITGKKYIVGTIRDVTEREKREQKIRTQAHRLDEVFNNIQEGIGIVDEKERIIYCNPAFVRIFEQDAGELTGRSLFDLFPPEAQEIIKKQNRERRKGKASVYELPLVTAGGKEKYLLVTASPRYDEKNNYRGAFGSVLDITDRKRNEDRLREMAERLQIIFEFAPEAYYLTDTRGRFVDGNRAAEEMSGYSKEELVGRTVIESNLLLREEISKAIRLLEANRRGQSTGPVEFTVRQKDGGEIILEISSYPVTIKGELLILNIARDITEHKKLDQQIQESEERFRTTFEQVAVGMTHVARNGIFLKVNKKFCDIVGYSRSELLKRRFQDITHPDDLPTNMDLTRQLLDGEIAQLTVEKRYIHKDGYPVWVHLTATLIRDSSGRPDYFVCVVEDIGVRKWAEEELKRSEERLNILFDFAPDGYLSLDQRGRVLDCNRMAEEMTGYRKKDLVKKNVLKSGLATEEELTKWSAFLKETIQGRPLGPQEFTLVHRSGRKLHVELSAFPTEIEEQMQVLVIARDITERKKQESLHLAKAHMADVLRRAATIDECLEMACRALSDAKLYQRAVMTLHNDERQITHLGQVGLDPKVVERARRGAAPDEALKEEMMSERFRISRSIFIPAEAELPLKKTRRYIQQKSRKMTDPGLWQPGDELFVPILNSDETVEGYLSVDTPWDGRRPDLQTILVLEDIVETVTRQIHEMQNVRLLAESRETTQALMNSTEDSAILTDVHGKILALNEAAARRFGKPLEELIGIDGWSLVPDELARQRKKMMRQAIRTKEPIRFQDRRGDIHFDTTMYPVTDENGQVTRVAVYGRDITSEVTARESLQESEQKYREVIELLPTPVFEVDLEANITTTNQAGLDLFGYSQEEIDQGLNVCSLFAPEETSRVRENIAKRLRGESFEDHEYSARRKDGTAFPVIVVSGAILRDGKPVGVRGVLVDITERRKLENTLRESEEKFRGLAENVPDAIFATDANGRLTYISPAIEDILGYSPEAMVGKLYHAFLKSSEVPVAINHFRRVIKSQAVRSLQLDMKRKDRSIVSTELSATPIRSDGKIIGTQGIIRDISERMRTRSEIEKLIQRYRNIVNLAPDAVITVDRKGTVTACNDKFLKQYGLMEGDILGKPFWKSPVMNPNRRSEYQKLFQNLLRSPAPRPFHLKWSYKRGQEHHIEIRISFLREGRKKTGLQAYIRDITEELKTRADLERSKSRLRKVVETAPDGIYTVDTEGRITSCNAAALVLGGHTRKSELVGKKFTELKAFKKTDVAELQKKFAAVLRGEIIPPVEFVFQHKDGTVKWGEGLYSLLKEDEKTLGILVVIRDITKRKREEQIQRALSRISDAVHSSEDLKQLYEVIHRQLYDFLKTKNISICLFDHAEQTISVQYHRDEKDHFEGCIPAERSLTAYLVKKNKPLLLTARKIRELKRSGTVKPLGAATKAWMGVPLRVEGRSIGALVVNDYRSEQAFNRQDMQFLELVSDTIALSLQRKRTEIALKESEALFHTLTEQSPHMIWVNAFGSIVYANKRCQQVFGYKRKDFYAEDFDFLTLMTPASRRPAKKNLARHKKGRQVPPTEYTFITRRGRKFKALQTTKLITYRGQPAILGILEEIE
jgi:PAS domain S-box-containing protein